MTQRIARTVVHYADRDPTHATGGVESFARGLELCFEQVVFMTPATRDEERVRRERLPVICDNQRVLDWPPDVPVVGFQHGVAALKVLSTRSLGDARLALRQRRAAKRARTLWVACAQWIARAFNRLHGSGASHVIYHPIDLARFDGRLDNAGSRLVLHDGRSPHKGSRLYPVLARAFPDLQIEPLACDPRDVPDRLRRARAFLHLSRYEGNSLVCAEAMAMNLPCLFTRVGLFKDDDQRVDAQVVEVRDVFGRRSRLVDTVRGFLDEIDRRSYRPRPWCERAASPDAAAASWRRVLDEVRATWGW
jgi:hypothetical protein